MVVLLSVRVPGLPEAKRVLEVIPLKPVIWPLIVISPAPRKTKGAPVVTEPTPETIPPDKVNRPESELMLMKLAVETLVDAIEPVHSLLPDTFWNTTKLALFDKRFNVSPSTVMLVALSNCNVALLATDVAPVVVPRALACWMLSLPPLIAVAPV